VSKRVPQRTCIGCRATTGADELVRVVASPDDQVVVDLRGRLPGRGAWVHARAGCLDRAIQALPRALGGRGAPRAIDATVLPERVRQAAVRTLGEALSLAAAGGALARGRSAVGQAVKEGRAVVVLLSSDAAARTVRQVHAWEASFPGEDGEPAIEVHRLPLTSDQVGQQVGRGRVVVLAALDAPASLYLRRQLRRLRSLG